MKGGVTRSEALMMSPKDREEHVNYITKVYEEREAAITGTRKM